MTRETLAQALSMIDERHVAYVTDKESRGAFAPIENIPSNGKPSYIIGTRADTVRNVLSVAASVVFAVAVIIAFILMRQSITPPPADTTTDAETGTETTAPVESETETETETETEMETETETETEAETEIESDHLEKTTLTVSNVIYEHNGKYAEVIGLEDNDKSQAIIFDSVEGVPVTSIRDGAFDSVPDPLHFRIMGQEGSFVYDYAVKHSHIFIELYNGTLPNHYYPDGLALGEWVENTEEHPNGLFYIARDDNDEIDALVAEYLSKGTGYDELLERVLHRFACAEELHLTDWMPSYYVNEGYLMDAVVNVEPIADYDRYTIYYYREERNDVITYDMVKYGELKTYDEFVANAKLLFSEDYVNVNILGINDVPPRRFNADGYLFEIDTGIGTPPTCNHECELIVSENEIVLRTTYQEYYDKTPGEAYSVNNRFIRYDYGWAFDDSGGMVAIGADLYEKYVGGLN